MIGALWTGISGLAAQQTALDNESHNIANVNTVGYKSSRISFADQMYQDKIGKGSKIMDAEKIYTQGNLKVTGVSYDLALSGNGFFAMAEANATGSAEIFYTRAGNFRMGDNGNFQDAAGNQVQGWAMRTIDTEKDVSSTNPNVTYFNSDYTKLVTSKVVKHSNYIETFASKTTDYTLTAKADSESVFAGSALKSQANKVSDVEELIKNYSAMVQNLSENPDGPSASSSAQITYAQFPNSTSGAITAEGHTLYVYIDSVKYQTSWDTDYETTLKALADEVTSKVPGMNVLVANDANVHAVNTRTVSSWEEDTSTASANKGVLKFESMIPGKGFTISELGATAGTIITQGNPLPVNTIGSAVVVGTGKGAVDSARDALSLAVSGKQVDVFTPTDLGSLTKTAPKDFTYSATIYDPATKSTIKVPASGNINIVNPGSIDEMVVALNGNAEFAKHLEAVNINNNLVIRTKDNNADVEFSSSLIGDATPTALGAPVLSGSSKILTYSASPAEPDSVTSYLFQVTTSGGAVPATKMSISSPSDMAAVRDAINANAAFTTTPHNLTATLNGTNQLVIKSNNTETLTAATSLLEIDAETIIEKNAQISGRRGAGAELLEMVTAIDQTASRGSLQLRLDTLGISDSAFGEFSVDSTGLITMKQDGADFAIGQIGVAMFNNNRGLNPTGNNLLQKTNESGEAIYNLNNAKAATVEGGTLELSEADLSESLVNLMVFQRAFEANAKSITSADELLNTLINLKR